MPFPNTRTNLVLATGVLIAFTGSEARAADAGDAAPIEDLAIDELLNTPVEVASRTARSLRETPGVVTVITREEILASGARDLVDLLQRVPGFWFGVDVAGVVGVGFRGNWAHEGKVLLRIDGQEMNENLYGTLPLGNHFPVDQLEKIEIIRGPGSVIYSGYAELAVIDVTTRAATIEGASVSARYGQYPASFGHRDVELAAGHTFANGLRISGIGLVGQGNRSDGTYTDLQGNQASLRNTERVDPAFVDLGASWHDVQLRLLFDDYRQTEVDGYDQALQTPVSQSFRTIFADLQWTHALTPTLKLTLRANHKDAVPWQTNAPDFFYSKETTRTTAQATVNWEALPDLNVLAGVEGFRDHGALLSLDLKGFQTLFGDSPTVTYWNGAAFAQALWDTSFVDLAAGVRFERHSQFGNSFVPRLALTRVIDRFHLKLLASAAFRAPVLENINAGPHIQPERTTVFEVEAGYRFGEHFFASVNAFDVSIGQPIVYAYDATTNEEAYLNFTRSGTHGVELDARYRTRILSASAAFSFSSAAGQNEVASYAVPGNSAMLLGLPQEKLVLWGTWEPLPGLTISPSAIVVSERASYLPNASGEATIGRVPAAGLVNLYVAWRDRVGPGITLGAGVFNLLNASVPFVEPYTGGHAPLPGSPRELLVRASYDFGT